MSIKEELKNKLYSNDLLEESRRFVESINFFAEQNYYLIKENFTIVNEGVSWLVRLLNNEDVLIEKCAIYVKNENISFLWVDYKKETNQFIVEINYKDGSKEEKILLDKSEFVEMYP